MPNTFLDFNITPQSFTVAIQQMLDWVTDNQKKFVSCCTVYTLMQALENEDVFSALEKANMRAADGMPLVWLLHKHGFNFSERVYGPDIMLELCKLTADNQHISHFFLGSDNHTLKTLEEELLLKFPKLSIAGTYSPVVAENEKTCQPELVERLNASHASIIWVSLGSPKQDLWMARYRPVLEANLLISVGAAFGFLSGKKKQAPLWMQKSGLEWLFRLVNEPRRLWKRYILYNLYFIFFVISTELL